MKASLFVLTGLVALVAASPIETRQCAGCEPSGKGSSGATSGAEADADSTSGSNATNNNDIAFNFPPGAGGGDGGKPPTNGDEEEKGSCKACIDFCTGRGDLVDGLCKTIVCGIDCVIL